MSEAISAIFWGIITFSILVFLHEGGHFLAARLFGIKVHDFFIGLPGPSLSFTRKGTRYGVTAIPLGGYVRIAGMEGDAADERLEALVNFIGTKESFSQEEIHEYLGSISADPLSEDEVLALIGTVSDWDHLHFNETTGNWDSSFKRSESESAAASLKRAKEGTYLSLGPLKRIAILLSGVIVNVVVALAIFTIVLASFGHYKDVGAINPSAEGPAAEAGLRKGDVVAALDGVKVQGFEELSAEIGKHKSGDQVSLDYLRNQKPASLQVTLGERPEVGGPYLGVGPELVHVQPSVLEAFKMSFGYIGLTLKALAGFFNPATFASSVEQSSSIVGISVMTARAAQSSPLDYAWVVAAISLSLGIMNVLPIPPLDGGKVLMEIIGAIRKKEVSYRIQMRASMIGFGLLMILVVFLTYNDISRLLGA